MTTTHRSRSSRYFPVIVLIAVLFLPWPDRRGWLFVRCVATTTLNLQTTAAKVLGHFTTFQADLNTPGAGEYVLPPPVQDMLTIFRGSGRDVERFQISEGLAADAWTSQQIVASTWPRRLEKDATARFVLNDEPAMPGCRLVDKQGAVSLVYCP